MNDEPRQFQSITSAIMRYIRLYQLLGTPRSIPLRKGSTQVSRGDAYGRWQQIRAEFTELAFCFPSTNTLDWQLLIVSMMSNVQTEQRRKRMEELTGKRWPLDKYELQTARAYGDLGVALRERNLLEPQTPYVENFRDEAY
jgi:hypothetical protein